MGQATLTLPVRCSLIILGLMSAASAFADIDAAKHWLSTSAQGSSHATDLQTLDERLRAFSLFQTSGMAQVDIDALLEGERSTEALVRAATISHHQQAGLAQTAFYLTQVLAHQNPDGGFGHLSGWQSHPLDTAYVLLALADTQLISQLSSTTEIARWNTAIQQAVQYLLSQQQANGSYQVVSVDQLYVSAYVLSALTAYATTYAQTTPSILRLVTFLQAAQLAPAQWSNHPQGLFIDALVAESLHPYHQANNQSIGTTFRQRVEAAQQQNGSWDDDAYVTALILRSLQQQSSVTTNPIVSTITLNVIDSETSLPLSDVTLTVRSGTTPASATSNASGALVLSDLSTGNYTLELSRAGYAQITLSLTVRQGERLNLGAIKLSRATNSTVGMIQGRVTDSMTGVPIADAQVTVVLVDAHGQPLIDTAPIIAKTASDGSYQILTAQPSTFGIDVRKDGYIPQNGNGNTTAGGVVFFSPKLQSAANFSVGISGTVVNEQNQPLSGAQILSNGQLLGTTDSLGQFRFNVTTAGQQTWTVEKPDYQTATLNVSLSQSQTLNVGTVRLPVISSSNPSQSSVSTGEMIVQVTDNKTNKNIYGYTIKAELLDANNSVTQTQSFIPVIESSQQSDDLTIRLAVGRWRLTTSHPSYASVAQVILVEANQQKNVSFSMLLNSYSISGILIDSQTNSIISNAKIIAFDERSNREVWSGFTSRSGEFMTPSIFTAPEIRMEFSPIAYVKTKRVIDRLLQTDSTVKLGIIRIRPESAEVVLPDLAVERIFIENLSTDQQTLLSSGFIGVEVSNKSNIVTNSFVELTAYIDKNKNNDIDDFDLVLGRQIHQEYIDRGGRQKINININGELDFLGQPISIKVDSRNTIPEKNENNNIKLSSEDLIIRPKSGILDPDVTWFYGYDANDYQKPSSWRSFGSAAAPVAAPLEDTNGDGVIGYGDIASIVYITMGDSQLGSGRIVSLNGKTGKVEWERSGLSGGLVNGATIADVDGDRKPEVIFRDYELNILSNKGELKRKISTTNLGGSSRHLIAVDIDNNGSTEIISGLELINYIQNKVQNLPSGMVSVLASADLDGDNSAEIIGKRGIAKYNMNSSGQSSFSFKGFDAEYDFVAVADLYKTGSPNLVLTGNGSITILDNQGNKKTSFPTIDYSSGGAPTISDFNGDGEPDVGVASAKFYTVYNNDGSVIWSSPIEDLSSAFTGSSVFDFDNDGRSEVIYADENYLRIFNAEDGQERYKIVNSSWTWSEYPIVVDADADQHADIIFVSNAFVEANRGGRYGKMAGIRMLSGKNKDWADTRNIWNQYSYHITNIDDDLTVPKIALNSWSTHNTYRRNLLIDRSLAAADLTASFIQIEDNGWFGSSTLNARVGNAGGKRVPAGTPVAFYRIAPAINGVAQAPVLLHVATLSKALEAGDYEDVAISYSGSLADFGELVVIANDAGAGIESLSGIPAGQTNALIIQEYTRTNNIARLSIGGGFQSYTLSSRLDQADYQPNQTVQITAQATNLGSFDADATIRMTVLDQIGNVLSVLPLQQVTLVAAPDQAATVTGSWNTSNHRTGAYVVRVELIRPSVFGDAEVVATSTQGFSVGSGASVDTGLTDPRLFADKANYNNVDVINATLQLRNTANNEVAGGRTTTVELVNASGTVLWSTQTHLDQLSPNALDEQHWQVPLNQVDTGLYVLRSTTRADDGRQTDQVRSQTLTIVSNASTLIGVTGTLSSNQTQINLGEPINLTWSLHNQGAAINQLPTRIVLINENTGQRVGVAIDQRNTDLAQTSSSDTQGLVWNSAIDADQIDQPLMVMLQVQAQNGLSGEDSWQALAYRPLKISQPPLKIEIGVDGQDDELSQASGAPLLVYYSCHEGWNTLVHHWSLGQFSDTCFATRAAQLTPYLDRLNIPYTLVKEPRQFRTQLRSGVYGQYWMLGAVEQLQQDAFYELREAAHLGDGLLVDSGMHSWSNEHLFALAGADPKGRLRLADGILTVQPIANTSIVPPLLQAPRDPQVAAAPLTTITPRRGQPLSSNWPALLSPLTPHTQVAATFDGRHRLEVWWASVWGGSIPQTTYPAITTAPYGQGYPVGVAFDLISTLQHASTASAQPNYSQQRWDQVLKDLSRPRRSAQRSSYVPAEVVRIPITLDNPSSSNHTVTVVVDLPTGSTWHSAEGGLDTLQNGQPRSGSAVQQVRFNVTIPAQTTRSKQLTLRLPKTAGTAVVRTRVYSEQNGTTGGVLAQQESRFVVRSIEERLALIKQTINQWRILGADGAQVTLLKVKVGLVEKHLRLGLLELAIDETTIMGATLASMSQTANPQVRSTRLETGELLKALEIKWYLDNPDNKAKSS